MSYAIRTATPGDAPAITVLLEASYPKLFAVGYDMKTLAAALPRMTKANPRLLASGSFFVAEIAGGEIAGCGGWSKEQPGSNEISESIGHIRHFATHPDWLRRGIGRAIVDRCVEQALAAKIRRLECYSSLVAVDFYQTMGFGMVRPVTVELGPDATLPGYLMRRDIG